MKVNYIALAVPVFFVLIAIEVAVAWFQRRALYRVNDAITDLSCGIGQQIVGLFVKGALIAGYGYVYEHLRVASFGESSVLVWVIAFLGVDFFYYWWHRLSHEVAVFWAIHVVHHQSEEYNLAVALRQAWFSGISSWAFYLPLAFVGVPPLVFVAMSSFNTLYQFWIHTRTIGKLGPLEWVLNTPAAHRVHHGRNPKYLDRNYAGTLIVWDRLFGSYQDEEEEPLYGTVEAYRSWNSLWANFDFFVAIWRKAQSADRWIDKLKVWFMPPGWVPPGVADTHAADVEHEPRIRFDTFVPRGMNLYVLAQFVPVTVVTTWLMFSFSSLDLAIATPVALWVLATTLAWGGLFETRRWAWPFEVVRLGVSAGTFLIVFAAGEIHPVLGLAGMAFYGASAVWMAFYFPIFAKRRPRTAAA